MMRETSSEDTLASKTDKLLFFINIPGTLLYEQKTDQTETLTAQNINQSRNTPMRELLRHLHLCALTEEAGLHYCVEEI